MIALNNQYENKEDMYSSEVDAALEEGRHRLRADCEECFGL